MEAPKKKLKSIENSSTTPTCRGLSGVGTEEELSQNTQTRKNYIYFFIALFILSLSSIAVFKELKGRTAASNWLAHSYQVIDKIEDAHINLTEAEKQLLLYRYTNNQRYLISYSNAIKEMQRNLVAVKLLIADNVSQQISTNEIETLLKGVSLAPVSPNISVVEQSINKIKTVINTMIKQEQFLCKIRYNDLEYERASSYNAIVVSTSLGYLVLILSFLAIVRLIKKNQQQYQQSLLIFQKMATDNKALLESVPDGLITCNQKGQVTAFNRVTERLFGYTHQELIGKKIEFLIPNRYAKQHEKHRQNYFKNPHIRPMGIGLELYGKHKDGHEFPVDIYLSPLETDKGMQTMASVRDVTERKQLQDLLAESEARWKFALESANQGVWDWYVPEKKIYFSHTWKRMLGYQDDEITNEQYEFEARVHPDDLEKVRKLINEHFEQKTNEFVCEARFRCKNGDYKWILDRGRVIKRSADGKVLRAIGTHTDISYLKKNEAKLKHIAEHDPLTGLINRPIFQDRLTQTLALAKRNKNHAAVFFVDIDGFKQINDSYGHATGDLLLCAVTNRLQTCIRDSDTLARFGGDEFVLLLAEINAEKDVIKIAKKIRQSFSKGFVIEDKKLLITLSIGISLYPEDGNKLLIESADTAMYYVKTHGKNNFKLFDNSLQLVKK